MVMLLPVESLILTSSKLKMFSQSDSASAETMTVLILKELYACGPPPQSLCGFGSDGASVMAS